jgi:Ca2+-binding EF-hand superfamily protein
MLSPGLISKIQTTVYRPVLERVRFFGWNPDDAEENQTVQTLFEKIDVDGDGTVTMEETNALLQELKVELEPGQLKQCFLEMDRNGNNSVKLEEFQHWCGKPLSFAPVL